MRARPAEFWLRLASAQISLAVTLNLPVGVYPICVRGADAAQNTTTVCNDVLAVYDPSGGFVTGGGWFNSPAGAYALTPALTGRAEFGFVSKYQNGATAPTGETKFQFVVANLQFTSTSYDWLVIAGARGQYKGYGKINGKSNYRFLLTAVDGSVAGGDGVHKFRIRIWHDTKGAGTTAAGLIYDNQVGAADGADLTTALDGKNGGGSIVIHK